MRGFKAKSQVTSYKLQVTSYKLQVTSYKLQVTSYKKGDQGRLFLFVLRLETCNLRLFFTPEQLPFRFPQCLLTF